MQCEMCGKSGVLVTATIEGVDLKVCPVCAKLGKVKTERQVVQPRPTPRAKETIEEVVVENAGKIIKELREKRGMRQIDLAKMLQMKDSLLHLIETEHLPLSLPIAKHIEETLGIVLIKQVKKS